MDNLRIGRISSVNHAQGTARVTYEDRDNMVSTEMPLLAFGFIYWMPKVGDPVMVVHAGNGSEAGIILGRYWCNDNLPPESGAGLYRHDMDRVGQCYFRHQEGDILQIYSPNGVEIVGNTKIIGTLEVTEDTTLDKNLLVKQNATVMQNLAVNGGMAVQGGSGGATATITGNVQLQGAMTASGDIVAGGISLDNHTHTGDSGGQTSGPH